MALVKVSELLQHATKHRYGVPAINVVSVETAKFAVKAAELGHVGEGNIKDDIVNSDHYTKVDRAVEFVERTGCGSLAVAVGNAHGPYCTEPNLDFDRIKELRAALDLPLVMHGCSGIPDEQMQEAVNLGMSKFNIATEYFKCMYAALAKMIADGKAYDGDGISVMDSIKEPMHEFVASKLQLPDPNHFSL